MKRARVVFAMIMLITATTAVSWAVPPPEYGKVELLRDAWGTANVFATTDAGAMYGLGYACAEDRGFQMYYFLRMIQGRLAESMGGVEKLRGGSAADSDALMRVFGFARAAEKAAAHLDAETRAMLEAYSLGVNGYFADNLSKASPLFDTYELVREPWTPEACILSWWHLAQFFSKNGLRDAAALERPRQNRPEAPRVAPDDDAAVVRREDVTDAWIAEVDAFLEAHGIVPEAQPGPADPDPKFSHAWVIGGKKTTTGSAVLVSDPQTPVWNPSVLYEFHVRGATYNVRGAGVPGSPLLLIGFNEHVAWGMTALGADQADLFLLETDPAKPDQYQVDGEWLGMTVWEETVRVKDGEDRRMTLRETIFGPVVTDWLFSNPSGKDFALARVPIVETDRETVEAVLPMFRAKSCGEFAAALPKWRFPTANCIFGDAAGDIGYWSLGAMPVRSPLSKQGGMAAQDGRTRDGAWQTMIPYELLPHVINPKRGYLVTANHRSIQSFYKVPFGVMTGSAGDTDRGLRIKERIETHLAEHERFSPEDVLAIQSDSVNVWKREIAHIGFVMQQRGDERLKETAAKALDYLRAWYDAGAAMDTGVRGTELAEKIQVIFRGGVHAIVARYGGGVSGLARFAKATRNRFESNPDTPVSAEEASFANAALSAAWTQCQQSYGADPRQWHVKAAAPLAKRRLGYLESLDGYPGLDAALDMPMPRLKTRDGGTILSQQAQAYTQFVPLHDTDAALSILPPGSSETPGSPFRFSTYGDWARGKLHPAPLSRRAVDAIMLTREDLSAPARATRRPQETTQRRTRATRPAQDSPPRRHAVTGEETPQAERPPLPGKAPADSVLENAMRYLNRKERTEEEVADKIGGLREYIAGDAAKKEELVQGLVLLTHLMRESQAGRMSIVYGTPETLRRLEPFLEALEKK